MAKKPPPRPPSLFRRGPAACRREPPSNPYQQQRGKQRRRKSCDDEHNPESDNKTPTPSISASAKSAPESKSGSGEPESESDSHSEAAKLVSPISSKPIKEVKTPNAKSVDAEKSNGKASGKPLFQRICSLDDEIATLKAMAEFEARRGPIKLNASAVV